MALRISLIWVWRSLFAPVLGLSLSTARSLANILGVSPGQIFFRAFLHDLSEIGRLVAGKILVLAYARKSPEGKGLGEPSPLQSVFFFWGMRAGTPQPGH